MPISFGALETVPNRTDQRNRKLAALLKTARKLWVLMYWWDLPSLDHLCKLLVWIVSNLIKERFISKRFSTTICPMLPGNLMLRDWKDSPLSKRYEVNHFMCVDERKSFRKKGEITQKFWSTKLKTKCDYLRNAHHF